MTGKDKTYEKRILKRKRGKTDPSKMYFNADTQEAIVAYAKTTVADVSERRNLYSKRIMPAFKTLVENLVNVHKFNPIQETADEMKNDCVHFLYETIHKFDPTKGTAAFSYFNVVAKNWLIIRTKQKLQRSRKTISLSSPDLMSPTDLEAIEEATMEEAAPRQEEGQITAGVISLLHELCGMFSEPQEVAAIRAMIQLFETSENLELINKSATFLYIREISGCNQKQLSSILQKIRKLYKQKRVEILEL